VGIFFEKVVDWKYLFQMVLLRSKSQFMEKEIGRRPTDYVYSLWCESGNFDTLVFALRLCGEGLVRNYEMAGANYSRSIKLGDFLCDVCWVCER
jgi:hypothetical protein